MSLVKGFTLIAIFSLLWGILAGVNAVVLKVTAGMELGLVTFTVVLIGALVEALLFMGMVDYLLSRRRAKSQHLQSRDNQKTIAS